MSNEQSNVLRPPTARQVPHIRRAHGETFNDPYEWMRAKDSPDLQAYVKAQNDYYTARTQPLQGLKQTLFEELKSRVLETDMSVPTRIDGYWYFARTQQGRQYGVQCRMPIAGPDDWNPPQVNAQDAPGTMPGEEVVFDPNAESKGHDFFRLGGLDLSRDGRWLLYGVDTKGGERYDYRVRDLKTGRDLPEVLPGIGGACFTPDGRWIFYMELDESWRPCAVWRHRVGTELRGDVEVFREADERFWVGVGLSFDERNVVIGTNSKTTSEVWMLPVEDPEGEFRVFIPRKEGVEYDVSFARFEGAGEDGEDIPLALVYHNAVDPNFEIDVVDMRSHTLPFKLGEGVRVAVGSPYGCEHGDEMEPGASARHIGEPYSNPVNPAVLQGARGLGIEGIAMHRHFVVLAYQAESLAHVAVMTKAQAAQDFLAGRPWSFTELKPHQGIGNRTNETDGEVGGDADIDANDGSDTEVSDRLYSIGTGGNPSYDAPRLRYSFSSYTTPGELHELDVRSGEDRLLKKANVLGDFDANRYCERRIWIDARDGERVPVSLVYRLDRCGVGRGEASPMFITGYGAYEVSSDPGFSVSRLSMLDRGVLYAVVHVRGGGEMGRAWYEQGRRLNKLHTFEDFVDATRALQTKGFADAKRTVANGGSAGGLLMGAIANMAPECYAAVEADVPFVDALTSILDPSLPLTVTEWDEWGDPLHSREVYDYMKAYSPYENAPFGPWQGGDEVIDPTVAAASVGASDEDAAAKPAGFPRILATTSLNDTRVLYVEPLKWVARLQSQGVDAQIRIQVEAGHGGVSGRYEQWREVSEENAWCLAAMGIDR